MAEILVRYRLPVRNSDRLQYEARAYGAAMDQVLWEGWIEFVIGRFARHVKQYSQTA
jgi:hypothetical protein